MLLFDTNILVPWLAGAALPNSLVKRVRNEGAYVSPISIWEIWIKVRIGKLEMQTDNLVREVDAAQLTWLPVLPDHAEAVRDLPLLHRDPFDRLLLAQAKAEGLTIVTTDRVFGEYLPGVLVV
ncbi:MAG: type II toxin-antitoxin system VapC family toxin [Rhodocyclales bacterium]|nr:type II toxin-antitoxin system VapC family toxin [Rhodocyclales bacterium]